MTSTMTSIPSTASGNNILSDKVSRALEVRTDTPAMRAALDALSNLACESSSGNIDARSIRVATEQDALQQAKLLEAELKSLVTKVKELRAEISVVSRAAGSVASCMEGNVVVCSTASYSSFSRSRKETHGDDDDDEGADSENVEGTALAEEQKLAMLLADAFHRRELASQQYAAITLFLQKFDLTDEDSVLLDRYAFDDLSGEGILFLEALERVRTIRTQLAGTFGTTTTRSRSLLLSSDNVNDYDCDNDNTKSKLGAASAFRMMENLSLKQERAYERLYHFIHVYLERHHASLSSQHQQQQQSFRYQTVMDDDAMDDALMHPFLVKSLAVLRHVPAYYTHTLEVIATGRRSEVTRRFLLALTSGGVGDGPFYHGRGSTTTIPIEMKSHDPVNYVGDMLAFVFRAMSLECDLARRLISAHDTNNNNNDKDESGEDEKGGNENDGTATIDDMLTETAVETPMTATNLLAYAASGVARPLRSRISQIIASLARRQEEEDNDDGFVDTDDVGFVEEEDSGARVRIASLYSVCGLLLFYYSAMKKAVLKLENQSKTAAPVSVDGDLLMMNEDNSSKQTNPLIQCVLECLEEGAQAYDASLRVYAAMLDNSASFSEETPASLANAIMMKISKVRMSSPGFSSDTINPSKKVAISLSLENLCDIVVGAGMSLCTTIDDATNLKMSIHAAKGLDNVCAKKWDSLLTEKERVMADALIDSETKTVLEKCGLGRISRAIDDMLAVYVDGMLLSSYPGLSPANVLAATKTFYSSLHAPPIPLYDDSIKDPSLRKYARSKTAQNVADAFKSIYDAITNEVMGGYEDLSFLEHDPDQVRALLCL